MIMDSIDNFGRYESLNNDLYIGLKYLKDLSPDVANGEYELSESVKAIINQYSTKSKNTNKFEAHTYVIDVQYPIVGRELVQWSPLQGMTACTDYDAENDRTHYENPTSLIDCVTGNGVFAIYFPEDAHNPQLAVGGQEELIKKVTLKIRNFK